jgi:hypothetical protein
VNAKSGEPSTISSSRRFREKIKPTDQISEALLSLKPVTFYYKSDITDTPRYGLIAEEVAKVNPDLVVRDEEGAIYTVRYEAVNAMLLNEFLKQHRKVQEQGTMLANQQAEIARQQKEFKSTIAQQERDNKSNEATEGSGLTDSKGERAAAIEQCRTAARL